MCDEPCVLSVGGVGGPPQPRARFRFGRWHREGRCGFALESARIDGRGTWDCRRGCRYARGVAMCDEPCALSVGGVGSPPQPRARGWLIGSQVLG